MKKVAKTYSNFAVSHFDLHTISCDNSGPHENPISQTALAALEDLFYGAENK